MKVLPLSSPSGRLALVLRDVIERRGVKQKVLAKQIGISESSFSLILNAKARPRQITVTRLMQQLNCSSEEQQAIVSAYDHAEDVDLPLKPNSPERPIILDRYAISGEARQGRSNSRSIRRWIKLAASPL